MASHHFAHYSSAPCESPAKVFAQLKLKLQRDAGNEVLGPDNEWRVPAKHGGVFLTPRKRTETSKQMFGNGEITAVTLSPISSPQKNSNYQRYEDIEMFQSREVERACRPRGVLDQNGDVFVTPRKMSGSRYTRQQERSVDSQVTPTTLSPLSSPDNICSPEEYHHILEMERAFRLRKHCMSKERAFVEAYLESTGVCNQENAVPAFQHPRLERAGEEVFRSGGLEQGAGRSHQLSPVFSPMRKRLRRRHRDEAASPHVKTRTSEVDRDVDYDPCRAKGRKMSRAVSDNNYIRSMNAVRGRTHPEEPKMAPNHTDTEGEVEVSAESPGSSVDSRGSCDSEGLRDDPSHPVPSPPVLSQPVPSPPVLHEDPLVLNSPRFSIPQKPVSVFRRPTLPCPSFPDDNVVHLRKWHLRRNKKGLFVDGIHREKNIPWHSNCIMVRVSSTVLKTVTGRVYILLGKMSTAHPTEFPKWFLKRFANGFPQNWKELYSKYLSEATGNQKKESLSDKGSIKPQASLNLSVKRPRQRSLNTSETSSSTISSVRVSRSGRVLKPVLEYWRGGRVLLDADMNVTIHEGYHTITQPEETFVAPNPALQSRKTRAVKVPESKGCDLDRSVTHMEPVMVLRKVKVPPRRPHGKKISISRKPPTTAEEHERGATRNPTKRTLQTKNTCLSLPSTEEEKPSEAKRTSRGRPKKSSSSNSEENNTDKQIKEKLKKNSKTQAGRKRRTKTPPPAKSSSTQDHHTKVNTNKKTRKFASPQLSPGHDNSPKTDEENSMDRQKANGCFKKSFSRADSEPKSNVKTQKGKTKTPKPAPKRASRTRKTPTGYTQTGQEVDKEEWTEEEQQRLEQAVTCYPKYLSGYWTKVAQLVGTRSADECHEHYTCMGVSKTPAKASRKRTALPKEKVVDQPVISARAGTWKRKKQEREFLETMPKDDMDDVFSSAYMQKKRFEVPSMCPSDDQDFSMSDLEPLTPRSTGLPEAKTPQCLHITPGMMGSSSARNYDDRYVFQLQKRMKNKCQFNVHKHAPTNFTPTASVKKQRRVVTSGADLFVVREMFPDKEDVPADSDEEQDFYFSDSN